MNAESAYKECLKKLSPILRKLGATPVANTIDDINDVTPEELLSNIKEMQAYYAKNGSAAKGSTAYYDDDEDDYGDEEDDNGNSKPKSGVMVNIHNDDYVASNMISKILSEDVYDTFSGIFSYMVKVKCFDGSDIVYRFMNKSDQIQTVNIIRGRLEKAGVKFND